MNGVLVVAVTKNNYQIDSKPQIILFVGTTHDIYWYNRPCGPYKLATYLRKNGFTVQVINNSTALTQQGFQKVFHTYASENLLWVGFTSSWLAGTKDENYYKQWWSSSELTINEEFDGWYYLNFDDRPKIYSSIYNTDMYDSIWNMAKLYNADCQLLFGGSQLNRNEYFTPDNLHPKGIYVKGNAEIAALELSRRFQNKNYDSNNLPGNDHYDYNDFKFSFVEYIDSDHITSNEWLPIEIARGCAFKCAFCNYDMKGVTDNYVDAKFLREKIIELYERHGTTKFVIMDDLYNDNYDKVRDLHENCWSKLPFKPELAGYLRLDLLWRHPEQAEMLRADGWRACSVGIETLNDQAGRKVGKGLGKKRILETLEMLKTIWQDQVLIHAFFIAGLPNESLASLEETYEWTKQTDLIHAVIWHWLELENIKTLPANVDKISIIGKDHKKYGYTFINNNDWVSNSGLTLEEAKIFNKKANVAKMNTYFTVYADMRAFGMAHDQIMQMCSKVDHMTYYNWHQQKLSVTRDRLLKTIGAD